MNNYKDLEFNETDTNLEDYEEYLKEDKKKDLLTSIGYILLSILMICMCLITFNVDNIVCKNGDKIVSKKEFAGCKDSRNERSITDIINFK